MKTLGRIIAGTVAVIGIAGGVYLNGQGPTEVKGNLTYQGYSNVDEPNTVLVFDGERLECRTGASDLVAYGNPDGLEYGEKYDVKVKFPRWVGLGTIKSITPVD